MMPQEEKKHKRRVHYSGKYPKKFEEKYGINGGLTYVYGSR